MGNLASKQHSKALYLIVLTALRVDLVGKKLIRCSKVDIASGRMIVVQLEINLNINAFIA